MNERFWRLVGADDVSPQLRELMEVGPPWCQFPDGVGCSSTDSGRCCWPPKVDAQGGGDERG